jgi:hypothetical protein
MEVSRQRKSLIATGVESGTEDETLSHVSCPTGRVTQVCTWDESGRWWLQDPGTRVVLPFVTLVSDRGAG